MTDIILCGVCENPIPPKRLAAMPETKVCVRCSEEMGGEFVLEVSLSTVGKAGSLKKTGEQVDVKLKPREFKR